MSLTNESRRITVRDFSRMKKDGRKIIMLTGYDYSVSRILDQTGIDGILVGDSLGMTVLGYEDTTRVTVDDMIHHTKAVCRGVKNAMVVSDMPFMSYHTGIPDAVRNAGRLVGEAGAQAVKLEGGEQFTGEIKAIVRAGIPVMGHIGVTPQSVHLSGYASKGKNLHQAKRLMEDALALQEAGVYAIVLECVPERLAALITSILTVPTIGIGSGAGCDGQILVTNDMLGLYSDLTPKFAKKYVQLSRDIDKAVCEYIDDVRNLKFPEQRHSFSVENNVIEGCIEFINQKVSKNN